MVNLFSLYTNETTRIIRLNWSTEIYSFTQICLNCIQIIGILLITHNKKLVQNLFEWVQNFIEKVQFFLWKSPKFCWKGSIFFGNTVNKNFI